MITQTELRTAGFQKIFLTNQSSGLIFEVWGKSFGSRWIGVMLPESVNTKTVGMVFDGSPLKSGHKLLASTALGAVSLAMFVEGALAVHGSN